MRRLLLTLALMLPLAASADTAPRVALETTEGTIVIELYPDKAPATVANFLQYVDDGFYDGTVFHRVIPRFMIQGGGFTRDYQQKETRTPVTNEADNGLRNERGTLAMARTSDPHSATAQFFINTVNNTNLNHRGKSPGGWGYAVFGKVVEGMDVVDRISALPTGRGTLNGMPAGDVPNRPVEIRSAQRATEQAAPDTTGEKDTTQ
ncbi:cytosolic peptidylprolyl cis-trans isomerase, cyclophilin A-like protein [Alcanivorax sp. S71-1-4]|uniref:peptidylprolyl isomerase n=1 Tax=Alcanivorax sp. S71-1-4 TaxID=1177159 RepID=UPI001359A8D7|nr:cytosolic peptidylprolyl cis-trans isomerase, cyclophilin A-like protein [Alcanivorax sp. S71-1-4]